MSQHLSLSPSGLGRRIIEPLLRCSPLPLFFQGFGPLPLLDEASGLELDEASVLDDASVLPVLDDALVLPLLDEASVLPLLDEASVSSMTFLRIFSGGSVS